VRVVRISCGVGVALHRWEVLAREDEVVGARGVLSLQPVSLDSENLSMLGDAEYRVTWKADGTRFMLLLMLDGTYLIDRRFQFRRVQMRFPSHAQRHNVTLLDGEMVVDVDIATGTATRRYLAYDIMSINKQPVVQLPFTKRFELIESEVVNPKRQLEVRRASHTSSPCALRVPGIQSLVLVFRQGWGLAN